METEKVNIVYESQGDLTDDINGVNAYTLWRKNANNDLLKKGIWIYFWLWIIEGALRKWIFPGLSTPLLIVRDPVAIWILFIAWKNNCFPNNNYVLTLYAITIFSVFTAVVIGHGSIIVALYGARIFIIHFPLIFVIGYIFDRDDVLKMGNALLWLSIPMAILIYLQFNSPQSAFVNKGIGNSVEGGGFQGALGYFRPPGVFSFTTGNTQFFSFVAVFVLYFLLNQRETKRYLLTAAAASLLIAIPLSISRTLVFQVAIIVVFVITSIIRKPKYLGRLIGAAFGIVILVLLLSKTSFIATPIEALTTRFQNADESEGGFIKTIQRVSGGIEAPFETADFPFFGYGLGMGTNVGAQLLVGRSNEFLIAEGEWGRIIGELGIVLGLLVIFVRLSVSFKLLSACYKKLLSSDLLSWVLLSVTFQNFAQNQWSQPSSLGFSIIITGLTIASLTPRESSDDGNIKTSVNDADSILLFD